MRVTMVIEHLFVCVTVNVTQLCILRVFYGTLVFEFPWLRDNSVCDTVVTEPLFVCVFPWISDTGVCVTVVIGPFLCLFPWVMNSGVCV